MSNHLPFPYPGNFTGGIQDVVNHTDFITQTCVSASECYPMLGPMILVMLFAVSFIGMKTTTSVGEAFSASMVFVTIASAFLSVLELVPGEYIIVLGLLTAVSVFIGYNR